MCRRLDVEAHDVIAFGDALNDLEMLQWAGHGVATVIERMLGS